jgi:REP element-mobilizing transposase RayT
VFGSESGRLLAGYWLRVASKHGFAIDQVSVVPDHVHVLVRIAPTMSIEESALSLMNNAQYWMTRHYRGDLICAGIDELWQRSAYAGTCGKMTTALVKWFLKR